MIYDMAQGTKDAATTTTTAASVGKTFAWQECQCQVAILHAWCRLSRTVQTATIVVHRGACVKCAKGGWL